MSKSVSKSRSFGDLLLFWLGSFAIQKFLPIISTSYLFDYHLKRLVGNNGYDITVMFCGVCRRGNLQDFFI